MRLPFATRRIEACRTSRATRGAWAVRGLLIAWLAVWGTGLAEPASHAVSAFWEAAPANSEESNQVAEGFQEIGWTATRPRRSTGARHRSMPRGTARREASRVRNSALRCGREAAEAHPWGATGSANGHRLSWRC